jgi:hypothetical protein
MEIITTILAIIGALVLISSLFIGLVFLWDKIIEAFWYINYVRHKKHFTSQIKDVAHWFSNDVPTMNLIKNLGNMQDELGYVDASVLRSKYSDDKKNLRYTIKKPIND